MRSFITLFLAVMALAWPAQAQLLSETAAVEATELDPYAPDVEETLREFDAVYEAETGLPAHLTQDFMSLFSTCARQSCPVWLQVVKSQQRAYLYLGGRHVETYTVSTGLARSPTPNFDRHPNGRVYDKYTSTKYPEGDYRGLGNMPYAVFIEGGFAVHGTPQGNWSRLGRPASHGCIRMHPDHALRFNRLVRQHGIGNVWITVQN